MTPHVLARLGEPGVVAHGLRVKPGKPTVLGAVGAKPVIGLPGNPTSALTILDAVCAPVIAALTGAVAPLQTVRARLSDPVRKRPGWTWYVPMRVETAGDGRIATPPPIRSSQVSLPARAGGYATIGETVEDLPVGADVEVRILEGTL